MMVVIMVKMRYRCIYTHLEGTWGSGDIASFILSLSAYNRGKWLATSPGCFGPRARGLFPINRRLEGPLPATTPQFPICQIHRLVTNAHQVVGDDHKHIKLIRLFCLGKCYSW
jgi:hypothetical protein